MSHEAAASEAQIGAALIAERDRLRAEVEALHRQLETSGQMELTQSAEIKELRAEVEALRADGRRDRAIAQAVDEMDHDMYYTRVFVLSRADELLEGKK